MISRVAVGAAVMLAALGPPRQDIFPFPVEGRTLENGLRMVAVPFDSPGIVSFYLIVRTGSRDEVEPGHSGRPVSEPPLYGGCVPHRGGQARE